MDPGTLRLILQRAIIERIQKLDVLKANRNIPIPGWIGDAKHCHDGQHDDENTMTGPD
jgi:hypothetical protein